MLYCLMDGHARTATELAVVAEVSPSTASVHLTRLKVESLVQVLVQGKHRYYSLQGPEVARVLESLSVLAGGPRQEFVPYYAESSARRADVLRPISRAPSASQLHDGLEVGRLAVKFLRFWTAAGVKAFERLGIDVEEARGLHRRFAFACLDSERATVAPGRGVGRGAPETGASARKWVTQELDSRALSTYQPGTPRNAGAIRREWNSSVVFAMLSLRRGEHYDTAAG